MEIYRPSGRFYFDGSRRVKPSGLIQAREWHLLRVATGEQAIYRPQSGGSAARLTTVGALMLPPRNDLPPGKRSDFPFAKMAAAVSFRAPYA
ncbi:MAG: hypothetical protein JO069_13205 [Verrucomicrobia bacterium]|nr:hypothetical protein [Verrucomicrobiota bacterium]